MQTINIDDRRYIPKRTFQSDSWFGQILSELGEATICEVYRCDRILQSDNGVLFLVVEIKDAEICLSENDTEAT